MAESYEDLLKPDGTVYGRILVSDGSGRPTHQTQITAKQFRAMLNDSESADFASSGNAIVSKAVSAMRFDPDRILDTTSSRFEALMDAAIADGIIDAPRKAELIEGIPI